MSSSPLFRSSSIGGATEAEAFEGIIKPRGTVKGKQFPSGSGHQKMTTKWQKKIVSLAFIAVLSILLLSNAFVTLWIMTAIGFSTDGLPSLKVGSKNLHAEGNIFAMKSLFASRIMDYNGLIIQAFKNLSLVANSPMKHSSALFINENEVILASKRFVIMDSAGNIIFSTTPTETSMSAKKMKISGKNSKKVSFVDKVFMKI